ncbi:Rhodocoxin reductase [Paraburkholderia ultramafica]|uniref:Rhodocoxin reductase n=1 Tax=Paraburkholderia ultramafica TaxID=1544867 RepID=A0A6S7CDN0_9BURK|nr:FAD-dependent oxidoreductase [Paraburkholderia ultramafica]CAB3807031.1 Rhodocoxin reductase [Paraburkholderia ultramafica]
MSLKTVIVIGAGQAGAWAARTLRSEGFSGRILLVGDEASPPYERPPLSKEQLQQTPPSMRYLMGPTEFATLDIEWKRSSVCSSIDRVARQVRLAAGESIGYDKLILCTGGRARLPAISGINAGCVHTLRTIEDAARLRAALKDGVRLLVMGGGWIGLEVAAAARAAGCSVTLVEAAPQLCARTGSSLLSSFLARLHRSHGVELRLGESVVALDEATATGCRAALTNGTTQEVDLVVVGIGLMPNDALARNAGLACERGILVDRQCRTSDPRIFAAGDVTAMPGSDETLLRLESWQNAQDQAVAAARAVLGQDVDYRPVPFFWSQQYDALVHIVGTSTSGTNVVVRGADTPRLVAVEVSANGQIAFAICTNLPRDFRQLRKFVAEGTRVDAARLSDASVPLAQAVA